MENSDFIKCVCSECGHDFVSLDPESILCQACMSKLLALELRRQEQMIDIQRISDQPLDKVRHGVNDYRAKMRGKMPDYILVHPELHYHIKRELHRDLRLPSGFDLDSSNGTYRYHGIPIIYHPFINLNTLVCVYVPKFDQYGMRIA